jgi:hypothetical protein
VCRASVEVLRAAVLQRAEGTSWRQVAGEIGCSINTAMAFAREEKVQRSRTVARIGNWYLQFAAGLGPPTAALDAALGVLLEGLPPTVAARGVARLADVVRGLHEETGSTVPAWIEAVRSRPEPFCSTADQPVVDAGADARAEYRAEHEAWERRQLRV